MRSVLTEIWSDLESDASQSSRSGVLRRRVPGEMSHAVYLGYAKPVNQRLLLVRVMSDHAENQDDLPTSDGVNVLFHKLPDDPKECTCLCVQLNDPRFVDVFVSLADDLIRHVQHVPSQAELVAVCLERIRRWQAFLRAHGHDGLPPHAQRGLFGELWFLHEHLIPTVSKDVAVSSWAGPGGSPQDFRIGDDAVEIKTSTGKTHTVIGISNELQLDDAGLSHLFLGHISLVESHTQSNSLGELVSMLRGVLADSVQASSDFEDRLFSAGYLAVHEENYAKPKYRVKRFATYQVRDGFPRLVTSHIPPGVGDVRYSIVISDLASFEVRNEEVDQILGEP